MTQETRRDLRFPAFAGATVAFALMFAIPAFLRYPLVPSDAGANGFAALTILIAAAVVSESLTVLVPGSGAISLGVPLFVAVGVYAGPSAAALTAALTVTAPLLVTREKIRPSVAAFNLGNAILTTTVPSMIYVGLGGPLLAKGVSVAPAAVMPLALAATTGTFVNFGLGGLALSVLHGQSMRALWRDTFSWMLPSQVVLGFVGLAIAAVLGAMHWAGFTLFVLPLLVARQTYQQSVNLREAYADTIKSLVGALEAKDMYTKGHSVRVAEYTVMIAQAMGYAEDHVRRIEQAALLHDLGKVGVSRRVLSKEGKLTDQEYEEIKRHPDIGAHIVADVPYLADLVPVIQFHHQRLDGRGYGGDTNPEEVPLDARILAVADSYDAMTSARPYRGAMSHEAAIRELRENCGTQFDPRAVDAFERAYEPTAATESSEESRVDAHDS